MKIDSRGYAIIAAALFGARAPFSKLLLGDIPPLQLAGLLYLGSGTVLLLYKFIQIAFLKGGIEANLRKSDFPWLFGAVISGGILAPAALMYGLSGTPAATASILLNFEAAATTFLAVIFFREHIGKQVVAALLLLTLACLVLAFDASGKFGFSVGALFVLLACILWGADNNFTRNISSKDPITIVIIKGIGAGTFSFVLSLLAGDKLPSLNHAVPALAVGGLCYGASLLFFILALRELGSIRASAFFTSAPFIGAGISFLICKDAPTVQFFISLPFVVAGIFLLFRESHKHFHKHEIVEHDHVHTHSDEHHEHMHEMEDIADGKEHSHKHKHDFIVHAHNHMPDIHHRHAH